MGAKEELSIKIAGEIVLSRDPCRTIKKWREVFGLSQATLAESLGVSPSVICDYESGRRQSPGSKVVRRLVDTFIRIDEERGSKILRAYERIGIGESFSGAVLDMMEFPYPVRASKVRDALQGRAVANEDLLERDIYGYTILDSVKAILELPSEDFIRIYGLTSERALVFTGVSLGRSPFVAIRVSTIKPGMVVLHGIKKADRLGLKIAERDKIPVVLSGLKTQKELIQSLREVTG
jgi:putative transcriptional regulator